MWALWSPDGKYIAFTTDVRIEDGVFEERVGLVRSDGTEFRVLKIGVSADGYPVWSPYGHKLLLAAHGIAGGCVLTILDVDTWQTQALTGPVHPWGWTWAPGGDKIAYTSDTGSIWIINSNGSGQARFLVKGYDPQWSP